MFLLQLVEIDVVGVALHIDVLSDMIEVLLLPVQLTTAGSQSPLFRSPSSLRKRSADGASSRSTAKLCVFTNDGMSSTFNFPSVVM